MMTRFIISILIALNITATMAQKERGVNEAKGLKLGIKAPLFKAVDSDSNTFILSDALAESSVVIIFYRGQWCPVCNKHLSQIQDSLKLIIEKGAQVIAISAQKPEYLYKMADKIGAEYTLLYDDSFKISDAYDVTFKPKNSTITKYNTFLNAKLKQSQTDDSERLPIPATYIIDTNGTIVWRQFDPNYKNRSTVKDILDNIP